MAAFFRGLLLFLFGVLAGAAGILFLTPSFQVDVRRGNTAIKPIDFGASVASPSPAPAPAPVAAVPATPAPVAPTPAPAPTKTAATTVTPTTPAVSPVAAEASLDFAAISRHLILWPTAVTVKTPTTVAVTVEGQKPRDLALEAGAVLQLTRVLPTGQLEVRAKGEKFEIKSTFTDFAAELGKRVTELVAKGTKFDSPYPTPASPAAATAATTTPTAPAVAVAPVVAAPKKPLTLAERIDVLYGRKPAEPEAPVVPSAPAAPAAPAALVTPAPMPAPATPIVPAATPVPAAAPAAEPTPREAAKVEEKGKDLDRKMNQLFK
jgi:hypothetical protein